MRLDIKNEYKEFVELLEFPSGKYSICQVFDDFIIMTAIAIKNNCNFDKSDEELYFSIIKKYSKEELNIFLKLYAELMLLKSGKNLFEDVLGEIYQALNIKRKGNAQFFTPTCIANLMASINIDLEEIKNRNITSINDPACGSGITLLQAANVLKNNNIDYKTKLFVVGQDLDFMCFCMTYIQLSLAGIPGVVIQGDSTVKEGQKAFYTPQYILNIIEKNNIKERKEK